MNGKVPATTAFYHHPDAVHQPVDLPIGRRVAGGALLQACLRNAQMDVLHCVAELPEDAEHFRTYVSARGWDGAIRNHFLCDANALAELDTLMLPGPSLAEFAWKRARVGAHAYSLCGLAHTLATGRIMQDLFALSTSPIHSWDGIICTSRAVKGVARAQLDAAAAYLSAQIGASRPVEPQLPVIPLGVDVHDFKSTPVLRNDWRNRLNIADDDVAIMTLGRLSTFEKMHPAPLMRALQISSEQFGHRIHLLMTGWFDHPESERLHRNLAADICPSITASFPDGRDQDVVRGVRAAADIFALPVDNIQETFGIAPLEAMAAALPVVCSDWDGMRDTVVHGVTGFAVRTLMQSPGTGGDIANRYRDGTDSYHQYLGQIQQRTVVDVRQLATAVSTLIHNPDTRREMGRQGRKRASEHFDWTVVFPQYEAFWSELTERRAASGEHRADTPQTVFDPAGLDPFELYSSYPTGVLRADTIMHAEDHLTRDDIAAKMKILGDDLVGYSVAPLDLIADTHEAIRQHGPLNMSDISRRLDIPFEFLAPIVLWLLKFDLAQISGTENRVT